MWPTTIPSRWSWTFPPISSEIQDSTQGKYGARMVKKSTFSQGQRQELDGKKKKKQMRLEFQDVFYGVKKQSVHLRWSHSYIENLKMYKAKNRWFDSCTANGSWPINGGSFLILSPDRWMPAFLPRNSADPIDRSWRPSVLRSQSTYSRWHCSLVQIGGDWIVFFLHLLT